MSDKVIVRRVTATKVIIRESDTPPKVIVRNRGPIGEYGPAGPGVATGGTAGQFLRKQSGTNYDTAWAAPAISEVTGLTAGLAAKADQTALDVEETDRIAGDALLIPLTQKGAANGVASLDGTGKVPSAQLPIAAALGSVTYQGTWNATTNTPTIPAAASGNKGYYYRVATAGSTAVDGVSDWKVGDWIVSDGVVWQKVDNTDPAGVSDVPGLVTALGLKADQTALDSEETDRIAGDATLQAEIDALPTSGGNRWRTGAGLPDPEVGVLGDHYLNATTDRVYRKWTKPAFWAFDAGDTSPDVAGSLAKCNLNLPLFEGSGSPKDQVSGLTGTLVGGAAWATHEGIVGVDLDGVDGKITLPVQPLGNSDAYEVGVLFGSDTDTPPDGINLYVEQGLANPDSNYNALYIQLPVNNIPPGHMVCNYERYRQDSTGKSSWLYVYTKPLEMARLFPGLHFLHAQVRDYEAPDADLYLDGVRLEPLPGYPEYGEDLGFDENDAECVMGKTALGVWQYAIGDLGFWPGRIAGVFAFAPTAQTVPELAGFLDDPFGLDRDAAVPVDPTGWYATVAKVRGRDAGFGYVFNSLTTSADPGAGRLKLNNATPASATAIYLRETSAIGELLGPEIATWDDPTSAVRGKLKLYKTDDPAVFALYQLTGALTDNGDWVTLVVTYVTGAGTFTDLDAVTVLVLATGDAGDDGADATVGVGDGTYGDAANVPALTVVANQITGIASTPITGLAESAVTNLVADLAAKAPLTSPTFTGTPAGPTAAPGTNTTQLATMAALQAAITALIGTAPGVLDTLGEISDAINDDANLYTTLVAALAGKQPIDATLTTIAALTGAADKGVYFSGVDTAALYDLSAFGRTLAALADYAALRTGAGLVIGTDVQAYSSILAALVAFTSISDGQTVKRSGSSYVGYIPEAGSFSGAKVYGSSTQSLSNNTEAAVVFANEEYDSDGYHEGVTNPTRFTIPIGGDGTYAPFGTLEYAANATGSRWAYIYKNGVAVYVGAQEGVQASATGVTSVGCYTELELVAGDYLELFGFQSSGGALDVNRASSFFGISRRSGVVGPAGPPGGLSDGDYGDVVASGSGTVLTVDSDAITNAKLANMATATMKGRRLGTGDPEDLSASDARDNMGLGTLAVVTPTGTPDGTKFLRDDNSWQAAGGGGAPSGSAGGDLGGTYPNPSVAKLTTTTGPTSLTIGAIADGQLLKRSGSTVIGVDNTVQFDFAVIPW